MQYTKKRVFVLVIVFLVWCMFFYISTHFLRFMPLAQTFLGDVIMYFILPGGLITILLGESTAWYIMHAHPLCFILMICVIFIVSPGFYLGIAHLIMSRMERYSHNSKTKKGDILTLFGTNDKP